MENDSALISVEIPRDVAQALVDDPTCWAYEDKEKLLEAIEEAPANDDS
jgi:hypothetical protein